MALKMVSLLIAGSGALYIAALANAQEENEEAPLSLPMDIFQSVADEPLAEEEAVEEVNADEMANTLNSQQQLKQSFTLQRTIDGKVVESEKRTVTYTRDQPYRETESGQTTIEKLTTAFDGELLTRTEAFEEAKIDFTLADKNRNGKMSSEEFTALTNTWRESEAHNTEATTEEIARQRQYDAFLAEISPETVKAQDEAYAEEKFRFMAGAASEITREDYIREYLLDFDSMDANKDTLLKGDELMRFRALNSGEQLDG